MSAPEISLTPSIPAFPVKYDDLPKTQGEIVTSKALKHLGPSAREASVKLTEKTITKTTKKPFIFHTKSQKLLIDYESKHKNTFKRDSIENLHEIISQKFKEWDTFFGDTSYAVILSKELAHTEQDVILVKGESGRQRAYFAVEEIGRGTFKTGVKLLSTSGKLKRMISIPNLLLNPKVEQTPGVDTQKEMLLQQPGGPLHKLKNVARILRFIDLRSNHAEGGPEATVKLSEGIPGIMARYYSGGNLQMALKGKEKHLPIPGFYSLMSSAAKGLREAHKQHVCHRDVKPANIVREEEEAYIIDWGSAAYFRDLKELEPLGLEPKSKLYKELDIGQKFINIMGSTSTFVPPDVFAFFSELYDTGFPQFQWASDLKAEMQKLEDANVEKICSHAAKEGKQIAKEEARVIAKRELTQLQTEKWDVYSFCASAYQLATGELSPRSQRVHGKAEIQSFYAGAAVTEEQQAQDVKTMRKQLAQAGLATPVIDILIQGFDPNPFKRPTMAEVYKTFKHMK